MDRELLNRLGNPQDGQKFIHVAGTNGKGSTCAMLAEILKCSGYKTGLFISPHLDHYEERISINGEEISTDDWNRLKEKVLSATEGLKYVEFDIITAMAFLYFKEHNCDLVVLEVGLGGRLDATNVIKNPLVSAIASIGLEHTELLGDTLAKIATEKAGIIKEGCPAVVMYQEDEALDVFKKTAEEMHSKLTITDPSKETLHSFSLDGQVISYKEHKGLRLCLLGSYQYKNVALVLDVIDELRKKYVIPEEAIKEGLQKVNWIGRFEVLRKSPLVVIDGAHNPSGAEELAECIKAYLPKKKVHFVMGVLADKDYRQMLNAVVPFAKKFTIITPPSKRALSSDVLARLIYNLYDVPATSALSIKEGVEDATSKQKFKEPVIIFGSLYQVAEIRKLFRE